MRRICIGTRIIGEGQPCFIIAEGGLNHNGDAEMAEKLIETAAEAGADAIKFQTYTPEELFPPDHPDYAKFEKMVFNREIYIHLREAAEKRGIIFLSTPFDEASADLLEEIGVPAFKIGAGELTYLSFLKYIAAKKKPIILSTGMSSFKELDAAVQAINGAGNTQLLLMHCVSAYPCPIDQANVRAVTALQERYPTPVGFSDHTTSDFAALAAVSLGACAIEKHFTLSHHLPGWDHFFSTTPEEMKRLIVSIRAIEAALGQSAKHLLEPEQPIQKIARRAIYARRNILAGEVLTREAVIVRRPTGPLSADQLELILGKKINRTILKGNAISKEDME